MLTLFRALFSPPRHMILLVIATWIGLSLAEKRAERHGVGRDDLNNIIFYSLTAFVIGGRISFVLQNLSAFMKSPVGIVSINPDLFDPLGGIGFVFIAALIFGQARGLSFWHTLDALTPFFAVLAIGLGLSHLAAGTSFGKETGLPWGINLWNATRHPTQLYETLASLLTFILLRLKKHDPRPGILFLTFAAFTSGLQLFIQAFRADSILIFNGYRQGQVIAWIALVLIFILFEYRLKEKI
ncbi:MAG: prolipoprotein diacylglyceryl transferase [Chloroflexi bacterium]|nr:prolipoprotein diacylglyceryl transferase [Chloroflexota bacterium]